jgi:hypothetical protein
MYNNTPSLLASATQQQLHQMSSRNGLSVNYQDWLNGSCLIIVKFGEDIAAIPGSMSQTNIQVTANVENRNPDSALDNMELCVFFSVDGKIVLDRSNASVQLGVATTAIASGMDNEDEHVENPDDGIVTAGSFKSFFRTVGKTLGKAGEQILPRVLDKGINVGLNQMGLGMQKGGMSKLGAGTKLMA